MRHFVVQQFHQLLRRFRYVRELYDFKQAYITNCSSPPGHFYSPVIDLKALVERQATIWKQQAPNSIYGIDFNETRQEEWISIIESFYNELPFSKKSSPGNRYYYENDYYSYTDAIVLYSFIRKLHPARIVEVGSGFSSAVMLDTCDKLGFEDTAFTFIDPYPERLQNLITEQDKRRINIDAKTVQQIDPYVFKELEQGDILFIDSSHVLKTGSDVHFLLFEVLPLLNKGVYIHLHDMFYPFEYPKHWVLNGTNWNEQYLWRAFLTHNKSYEIDFFAHYMHQLKPGMFRNMPLCYKNQGGNLWLQKRIARESKVT